MSISIGSRPGAGTRPGEDTLAALVLKQAQEKRSRLIGTDNPGDDTANVGYAMIPGRLREADGREIGDLRAVLEFYQSLSPRRLVIIGAFGAGKTVFLLELQIRLLEQRRAHPDTPVPVLLSASGYDIADSWEDWLAGQISLEFSLRKREAAALVAGGRILPLVDGLDEMDPAGDRSPERAQALVRALNESMKGRERAPVVVACRPGEYGRLAESIDKARHAELSGLTGPEAAAYLRRQFRTPGERDRWTRVLEALEQDPGGPLAAELATPWKLTQALTTFRSEGDPAQLLPQPGAALGNYPADVERLLMDRYIKSAVHLNQRGTRYTYQKTLHWLARLADGLASQGHHNRSATDITLHEWRAPREGWITQLPSAVLMLLPFLGLSAIGRCANSAPVADSALAAVFTLSASGSFFLRTRNSGKTSNQEKLMARIGSRLANGLAFGLAYGIAYKLSGGVAAGIAVVLAVTLAAGLATALVAALISRIPNGLAAGLAAGLVMGLAIGIVIGIVAGLVEGISFGLVVGFSFGLAAGLAIGLTNRLTNFTPRARGPQTIIKTNGLIGFAGGIAAGLASGLTYGFAVGLAIGIPDGLSAGISGGLSFGLWGGISVWFAVWFAVSARIWIRYHFLVTWDALRGRAPLRFGKFLDWAVQAGILRESGISYQFRHRQLQDWLTQTP